MVRFVALALGATLSGGCSGEDRAPDDGTPPPPCPPPTRLVGDQCIEPGVADDGCPAGTLGQSDGSCRPAGIMPGECSAGLVHDGDVGCEPILPPMPCPSGLMAVPGETVCRKVMECGQGPWGDLPVDGSTVYVDQAFTGVSNGSSAAPWTTIGGGVAAASAGALIAVAAGSYIEDVLVQGKAVRLWGVCPERVEIVGTGAGLGALHVVGSSGTEVGGLAIRGASRGVQVGGATEVVFDRLWIHDNQARGVQVAYLGPTSVELRGSLVEQNHDIGVYVEGSEAIVEATVVRDTLLDAMGSFGRGLDIQYNATTGAPSFAIVRGSLVEQNHDSGVFVAGSEAAVEATVVRGTLPDATGSSGGGIVIQASSMSGAPSLATVRASFVAQNHDSGVYVDGSETTVEATVVRGNLPDAMGSLGRGLEFRDNTTTGAPSLATVRGSLVDQNHEVGVLVSASEAVVETTVVRGTLPDAMGSFGRGIDIVDNPTTGAPSLATVSASLIEQNHEVGVLALGSEVIVDASLVRDTLLDAMGSSGSGIVVQPNPTTGAPPLTSVRASIVVGNSQAGMIVVDLEAEIVGVLIRGTLPSGALLFGDGLVAYHHFQSHEPPALHLESSAVEDSARAGISSFGGFVSLGSTAIRCAAFELAGETSLGVPFRLEDRGGNACGCPEATAPCKAVSAGLEPPEPPSPSQ